MQMIEKMNLGKAPSSGINKVIPQVHRDGAALRKYFTLFESTQVDRKTPREAYAATIKPLLNTACRRIVCRLSAEVQNSYSTIKKILLEQADSRNDATIQQFWEHRKTKTDGRAS